VRQTGNDSVDLRHAMGNSCRRFVRLVLSGPVAAQRHG
jgi:hypothetical protein